MRYAIISNFKNPSVCSFLEINFTQQSFVFSNRKVTLAVYLIWFLKIHSLFPHWTCFFPLTCFFHSSIDCFLIMCNKQLITTESCHSMILYYITVFPFPSAHLNFLINLGLCQRKVIYLIFLLSNFCLTEEFTLLSLTNSISHEVCVAINYGSTSRSLWKLQLCLENHDCFIYPVRGSLHGVWKEHLCKTF